MDDAGKKWQTPEHLLQAVSEVAIAQAAYDAAMRRLRELVMGEAQRLALLKNLKSMRFDPDDGTEFVFLDEDVVTRHIESIVRVVEVYDRIAKDFSYVWTLKEGWRKL